MDLPTTISKRIAVLQEWLGDCRVNTIVLFGESGIGKTWMARETSNWAIREGLFDLTLWVYLDRARGEPPTRDIIALGDSIDHQLSLLPSIDEWEVEDAIEEAQEEQKQEQETSNGVGEKRYLVIVDVADGAEMNDDEVASEFRNMPILKLKSIGKVLITRRQRISTDFPAPGHGTTRVMELMPLTKDESFSLLQQRVGTRVFNNAQIKELAGALIQRTKRLPIGFVLLAKALSYFQEGDDSHVQVLKNALKEASENKCYDITQLLRSGYSFLPSGVLIDLCWKGKHFFRDRGSMHCNELIAYWMLEGYLGRIDSLEKAYEEGHHVLMELIDCQLLKSLDGGNICIDEANIHLLVGHCGIKQEEKHSSFDDTHLLGYFGTATIGLATVSDSKWKGFGRISHTQGMISTICSPQQRQKLSTLLLDGNLFSNVFLKDMLQSSEELQILFLSNWKLHFEEKETYHSLLAPLSSKKNLSVLLLRDCHLLENVDLTVKLQSLVVLEISGCNLKSMPDDFFEGMTDLQSLNLSKLLITTLPTSFYGLTKLLWLVLRGCSCLTKLESLKNMTELLLLDLSGATSLTTIVDTSFFKNSKLEMLNLSQTQISIPPFFRSLGKLTHLILSGCKNINRLRGLNPLTKLQVLDLSGSSIFKGFHNMSLGKDIHLDVLDLSGTSIEQLPSDIADPLHLYLKGCSLLSELSYIETLKRLEVLDVSGSFRLTEIKDTFFENLGNLQNVNLSGTSIKTLPSLSNLCELRQLLLSGCSKLEKLPSLDCIQKIEVLDLSGCKSLEELHDKSFEKMPLLQKLDLSETKIKCLPSVLNLGGLRQLILYNCTCLELPLPLESLSKLEELNLRGVSALRKFGAEFLKDMNHLQILNLSQTKLEGLPSLSNLSNLNQLLLGNCSLLKTVPELVELTNLEILDLSGTGIDDLPSLDRCSKLRKLLLRDCSGLREFPHLAILDVLGGTSKQLPYGISKLTHLEQLDLPELKVDHRVDFCETSRSDLNECLWRISSLPVEALSNSQRPSASVSGAKFLHLLKDNPSLLDTEFSKFHFSVHPTGRDELEFGGTCFRSNQFFRFREERLLEIHGFDCCPMCIAYILRQVHCLLLVDNRFESWLVDLGASNLKALKGCWFDRCSKMVSLFQPEKMEEDDVKLVDSLEVLGVSNAVKLESIFSQNPKQQMFQNLDSMYLDCCPELSVVFHSSFLPQSLKVLHIQFCDKIETLFQDMSLPKLETLHLLELSMLTSIGGTFPSLETLIISYCGNLETLFEPDTGTNCILTRLRTLQLQELPKLKMIGANFPPLKHRIITGCPNYRDSPTAT